MTVQEILSSLHLTEEQGPLHSFTVIDRYLETWSGDSWKGSNLEKWIQAMEFSRIEELHLAQEESIFYQRMKDELLGLRRLSFDWGNSGSSVPEERIEFIRSVPPLESLSITNWRTILLC